MEAPKSPWADVLDTLILEAQESAVYMKLTVPFLFSLFGCLVLVNRI